MNRKQFFIRCRTLVGLLMLNGVITGCVTNRNQCDCNDGHRFGFGLRHDCLGIDKCASIPEGAIPVPAGTYLHEYQQTQANLAEADDFVFYRNEWLMDGTELGPAGSDHLTEILPRVGLTPHPVVIEPSDDNPQKDQERRLVIIDRLIAAGIPSAEELVHIGRPPYVQGTNGEEAEIVRGQMLNDRVFNNMQNRYGIGGFGAGGGLGGFGGGFSGFGAGRGFGGLGGVGGFGGVFR